MKFLRFRDVIINHHWNHEEDWYSAIVTLIDGRVVNIEVADDFNDAVYKVEKVIEENN